MDAPKVAVDGEARVKKAPKWLRRLWQRRFFLRRGRTCLDCGFFGFRDGQEAGAGARRTVALEGADGWFSDEAAVTCHKRLWNWEDDSPFNIIRAEANQTRYGCLGFYPYSPGRSPEVHLKLEDERRVFWHQRLIALLAFGGGLLGALIGAMLGRR
jgi:hypothetical protein